MILYHFCCERDMRGIRNKGIIKGMIAVQARINNHGKPGKFQTYAMAGWQWLTLDGEKEHQSWNTHVLLDYDRTQYRWTVEIPERDETQIYDKTRLEALYPWVNILFDGWDGSENWRVYHGPIPKKYLKKLEKWNNTTHEWEEVPYGR